MRRPGDKFPLAKTLKEIRFEKTEAKNNNNKKPDDILALKRLRYHLQLER
jgi:hypothetical protein